MKALAIVVSTLIATVVLTGVVMGLVVALSAETGITVTPYTALAIWAGIAFLSFLLVRKYLEA